MVQIPTPGSTGEMTILVNWAGGSTAEDTQVNELAPSVVLP